MAKKVKTKKYDPPFAKDISVNYARGQVSPTGVCKSGSAPFYDCITGPGILPTCNPTGGTPDLSRCVGGGYHTYPACDGGLSATTTCISGQGQQ